MEDKLDFGTLDWYRDLYKSGGPMVHFKIVIFDDLDYKFAKEIHIRYPNVRMYLSVGTLPKSSHLSTHQRVGLVLGHMKWLFETVTEDHTMYDVCIRPQLHFLAWGDERNR